MDAFEVCYCCIHIFVDFDVLTIYDTVVYFVDLNAMICEQSSSSSVVYMYLPLPPSSQSLADDYLEQLTQLTDNLPPTVLVHGLNPVTSTTL